MDSQRRELIIATAARLFAELGVVNVSRRDIAEAAEVHMRSVNAVGEHRSDVLREVLERLPVAPIAEAMRRQADDPSGASAMTTLLSVAQQALGDPRAAWDPLELQALVSAPYDPALRALVGSRVERRWLAVREVLRQLQVIAAGDSRADEEAAVLHVLAVGVGLAVLSPVVPRAHDTTAWTALAARLIEALATSDPVSALGAEDLTRVWRARVCVDSAPHAVAQLTRMLSMLDVSLVSMTSAPVGVHKERSLVDLILRSSEDVSRDMIIDALRAVGSDVVVGRGESSDTEDVAARVLELSTRLLAHPDYAPQAAANLLLADSWEVVDASLGENSTPHAARLQWTVDRHVVVRRAAAAFTAGEYARASALLNLMDAVTVAHGTSSFGWRDTLSDGTEIITRLARPEDTTAVEALHARSSTNSLYQRYFMPKNSWREENLRKISGGHRGMTLVVVEQSHPQEIVAIGNAFPLDPNDSTVGEVALLVDDDWHGRGVGGLLLRHLVQTAPRLGFGELIAYLLPGNAAMRALLARRIPGFAHPWTPQPAPDHGAGVQGFRLDLTNVDEDAH